MTVPVVLLLMPGAFAGPANADDAEQSVIFVVDTSGSMGGSPIEQAKQALVEAVDALDSGIAAGIRSFAGSCGDGGDLLVPVGIDNHDALKSAAQSLFAGGGTPTPDALRAAAKDLPDAGQRTIVLISDGQSGCGDPCVVAKDLRDQGVDFTVHAVGFNATSNAEAELKCIADATGGQYFSATDASGLAGAIGSAIGGRQLRYVALGDSYSAGEGAGSGNYFQWERTEYTCSHTVGKQRTSTVSGLAKPRGGWDCTEHRVGVDIDCHRAPTAWSFQLSRLSGDIPDWTKESPTPFVQNVACSGATLSKNLLFQWKDNEQPQRDKLAQLNGDELNRPVDLVTVTIGGNDIGFSKIASKCFLLNGRNPNNCAGVENSVKSRLSNLDLTGMLKRLHNAAPEATIAYVSYPQVVPDDPADNTKCWWLSSSEQASLRRVVDEINLAEYKAVWQARIDGVDAVFVDISDALKGNEACTTDSHVIPIYGNKFNSEQAHPTVEGQKDIAEAVFARLKEHGVLGS